MYITSSHFEKNCKFYLQNNTSFAPVGIVVWRGVQVMRICTWHLWGSTTIGSYRYLSVPRYFFPCVFSQVCVKKDKQSAIKTSFHIMQLCLFIGNIQIKFQWRIWKLSPNMDQDFFSDKILLISHAKHMFPKLFQKN